MAQQTSLLELLGSQLVLGSHLEPLVLGSYSEPLESQLALGSHSEPLESQLAP